MTYEQYSPEWLIEHCDNEIAFERAVRRQMSRLLAENDDFRATIDHLTRENAGQLGEIVALKEQRDENEKLREENAKLQKWIVGEAQVAGTLDRKLRKAYKQRDELLEALKRIAMACSASARNVGWAAQHARAAIAKAGDKARPLIFGDTAKPRQPLTEADLHNIASNYFADEWAQKQAVMMLKDHGIGGDA